MGVSLVKGANISLTKEAPGLSAVIVGLGWDARTTDGQAFDLDSSAIACNTAGQVVGTYHLADGVYHGFLLSNGTYTTIDYPNTINTQLYGITDLGELVGQTDFGGRTHGFYAVKQ